MDFAVKPFAGLLAVVSKRQRDKASDLKRSPFSISFRCSGYLPR
jgi:hypothetical protein